MGHDTLVLLMVLVAFLASAVVALVIMAFGTGKEAYGVLVLCLAAFSFALFVLARSMRPDSEYAGSRGFPLDLASLARSELDHFGTILIFHSLWVTGVGVMLLGIAGITVFNIAAYVRRRLQR